MEGEGFRLAHLLPLFVDAGASGAGKTTVMEEWRSRPGFTAFSTDIEPFGATAAKQEYFNPLLYIAESSRWSG